MLAESGDGKVMYEGGSRKCMVMKEGMGVEELMQIVREITGSGMLEEKIWYSLKYDREMLVAEDSDTKVIFKGNDEHGYMYVAGNSSPVRSGRKCDDSVEVGEEGGNNQARVKRYDFDKDDVGDEEATKEDDAGDEQAAKTQCVDGNKRKGFADGNDVNDNGWPHSGIQARSYHQKLGKKMDKHTIETLKWKNVVQESIEQELADTYSLMLGNYSVELTNSRRLVVKLGQQTCTCRQWQMHDLPCYHALAMIVKANLWVYNYVHPIYKTATQEVIYNQLVHP
ncbi:LOW QUALITY PROTEIN: hypothetical protein Cgig2_031571 [Carnegiea gigantea]|uniref:SWIM-type domain-containing protein n=1 Tax=Carnegiea gigantea TaxID=171969 RepID=A0A9Q1JLH9_9CARY|nr:LOW QUALITY PROTEIN: hypothetical protein Cgig2_031571 [Carnegiea gigantea]